MDKLVTCPKCIGTGEILPEKPNKINDSKSEDNKGNIIERLRKNAKNKETHIVCPVCHGFGLIRG